MSHFRMKLQRLEEELTDRGVTIPAITNSGSNPDQGVVDERPANGQSKPDRLNMLIFMRAEGEL